jgi:hypothetical protein
MKGSQNVCFMGKFFVKKNHNMLRGMMEVLHALYELRTDWT